jgi:hypothetical protein
MKCKCGTEMRLVTEIEHWEEDIGAIHWCPECGTLCREDFPDSRHDIKGGVEFSQPVRLEREQTLARIERELASAGPEPDESKLDLLKEKGAR